MNTYRLKIFLFFSAVSVLFISCNSTNIEKNQNKNLAILKESSTYCTEADPLPFCIQLDESRAEEIRVFFKENASLDLYSIAVSEKTTWEKAYEIALFAATIPHDNQKIQPANRDSITLWKYSKEYPSGFNCRLHSIFLSELLFAAGIQNRFITCLSANPDDPDCHVVNIVWLPELNKWAMIDSDMQEYWIDSKGIPLSLEEMRNSLINGTEHSIITFSQNEKFKEYLEAYWTKNLYYFACHTTYAYSLEGTEKNNLAQKDYYAALIPPDFQSSKDYADIYTTDSQNFWSNPPEN